MQEELFSSYGPGVVTATPYKGPLNSTPLNVSASNVSAWTHEEEEIEVSNRPTGWTLAGVDSNTADCVVLDTADCVDLGLGVDFKLAFELANCADPETDDCVDVGVGVDLGMDFKLAFELADCVDPETDDCVDLGVGVDSGMDLGVVFESANGVERLVVYGLGWFRAHFHNFLVRAHSQCIHIILRNRPCMLLMLDNNFLCSLICSRKCIET